ncbi:MAG: hypothetical protein ACRD1O_03025, partial [Terriglobia bacterium]
MYERGMGYAHAPASRLREFTPIESAYEWNFSTPGKGAVIRSASASEVLGLRGWRVRGSFCHVC